LEVDEGSAAAVAPPAPPSTLTTQEQLELDIASDPLTAELEAADEAASDDASAAGYRALIDGPRADEVACHVKERAVYKLGAALGRLGQAQAIADLASSLRVGFFEHLPQAKTAKVVRTIVEMTGRVPGAAAIEEALVVEVIAWCVAQKRKFLRLRLQCRLSELLTERGAFMGCLAQVDTLLAELKVMDDKNLLVDVFLTEAKAHHGLQNLPKARASLTAARSNANAIYVSPRVQANIDLLSGSLHAEDADYKTAYSYFFEAYEALNTLGDALALDVFRLMVLCKIMTDETQEVTSLLNGKHGTKHAGPGLEAMRAVSAARKAKSLGAHEAAMAKYAKELREDERLASHLVRLGDELLEANLAKIVRPYSVVETAHVARLIALPLAKVETKLSQMILDKVLAGTLDQGRGHLVLYPPDTSDGTYDTGLAIVDKMGGVVDQLFKRSQEIE
jgi:26S proteasome regulatory subunit N6